MTGVCSISFSRYAELEKDYLFAKQRLSTIHPVFFLKKKTTKESAKLKEEINNNLFRDKFDDKAFNEYNNELLVESDQNEDAFWFKQKKQDKKV